MSPLDASLAVDMLISMGRYRDALGLASERSGSAERAVADACA